MRTIEELEKFVEKYFPHGTVEVNETGELIIFTDLEKKDESGVLGPRHE